MADDILKQLQDLQKQIKANMDDSANYGDMFGKFFGDIIQGAEAAGMKIKDFSAYMHSLGTEISKASDSFDVLGANGNIASLQKPLDVLVNSFSKLGEVVNQTAVFQQFGDKGGAAINSVTANLDLLRSAMTKLNIPGADAITNSLKIINENANEAEKLENSYIGLSAAGGDLNKIFDGQGGQLKNLSALTTAYSNVTAKAADATGLSIHQSMDFANALKTIPGVMDQNITSGVKGAETTNSLIGSMKLMTGTGQSQETVIKNLTTAYDDFASAGEGVAATAQKGAEFLATVSSVQTSLKLNFGDVEKVMTDLADEFRFTGNETDAAAKTIGKYSYALRESGVSGKASLEITKQLIEGIRGMSVGTKAFLSLRSGGPGGLQGAFQIDQLLRQGKLDQVAGMAEKSMRQQFGGRIVTQDESAQSPQAAAQYMKQQQLMQSGVFGIGKGMGADQIGKLIDAMAKGDTKGAAAQIKTGQDAVKAVTSQGTQIQERNNNELKVANRSLERIAISSQISALRDVRALIGTTGENAAALKGQMNKAVATSGIQNEQRLSLERGVPSDGDFQKQAILMQRQMMTDLLQSGSSIGAGAIKGVEMIAKGSVDAVNALSKINGTLNAGTDKMPPQIKDPNANTNRQTVMNRALGTSPQVNTMPAHLTAAGQKTSAAAQTTTGQKAEPMTIRLEISHPEDMVVKKAETNSIQKHNQASTVIPFN